MNHNQSKDCTSRNIVIEMNEMENKTKNAQNCKYSNFIIKI